MRTSIVFKEWAPDLPDMGPETLVRAHNVIPSASGYKPFKTLDITGASTYPARPKAVYVSAGYTKFDNDIYSWGSDDVLYKGTGNKGTSTTNAAGDGGGFAQYGNLVLFAGGATPQKYTIGSAGNFATLAASGTAPPGSCIGVLGQFVLIGDIFDAVTANRAPSGLQWSAIDDPTNWPTPNSATAIATQSGYQELEMKYGRINGIHGGDQHGVILQDTAITRVTYVGPPAVFQFDIITNTEGSIFKNKSIQAGDWIYFISRMGPCRTNGVTVERLGAGKISDYLDPVNLNSSKTYLGYDYLNRNLMIGIKSATSTATAQADTLLMFNEETNTWSSADVPSLVSIVTPGGGALDLVVSKTAMAYSSATTNASFLGYFQGTAGTAVIETSDTEINPGGRAYVDGVKPNVESSGTAPSIAVRVGYRDSLSSAVSYSSTATPNSATGFANFRVDAKYLRTEISITGNFEKVTGAVVSGQPSGER